MVASQHAKEWPTECLLRTGIHPGLRGGFRTHDGFSDRLQSHLMPQGIELDGSIGEQRWQRVDIKGMMITNCWQAKSPMCLSVPSGIGWPAIDAIVSRSRKFGRAAVVIGRALVLALDDCLRRGRG